MSDAKQQEAKRLNTFKSVVKVAISAMDKRINDYAKEIQERKDYLWEARRDMDHLEKIAVRGIIEQALDSAEILQQQQRKLKKLLLSPYFGRFDFTREDAAKSEPVYVGVSYFRDEEEKQTLVYDWRAPIASMFYDYELGAAKYEAPSGVIKGDISLKRQMKIEQGDLRYVFDSSVNIVDDVLKEALSEASDDEGMKNIVATIQRDQNAIIRNDEAHTLVIQGVAGSGKTSIALHRIAYLLYRFRDEITSDDILIISPNRVFADYIGNVLPELGEEKVPEVGMDDLAAELLDYSYKFQTLYEQSNALLESKDEELQNRIRAKSTVEFLRNIDHYVGHLDKTAFQARDWRAGRKIVPDWFFEETWARHKNTNEKERLKRMMANTEQKVRYFYNYELKSEERQDLRKAIKSMINQPSLRQAYKGLFEWLGHPEWFKPKGSRYEYADVFPLLYLKQRLTGIINPYQDAKHLLIDEMQDYTPLQYSVLNRLFGCRKTILGDASQSLNPYGSSTAVQIHELMEAARLVELNRSYRCSWEIMQYALGVQPNDKLVAMERHGKEPETIHCASPAKLDEAVKRQIESFKQTRLNTLAIICKTQKQANRLHNALAKKSIDVRLINQDSLSFDANVLICTATMSKGLEFDKVIVVDASEKNYRDELDRNLLYVACTRAMHELVVTYTGAPSHLLPE